MNALRFTFTATRDIPRAADAIQLSEIVLRAPNGSVVPVVRAANPGGVQIVNRTQRPAMVVDGDLTTKWLDSNFSSNIRYSRLELWLAPSGAAVQSVELVHEFLDHRLLHLLRLLEVVVQAPAHGLVAGLDLAQLGFLLVPEARDFRSSLFLGERVHLFGCGRGGGLRGGRALLRGGHVGIRGLDFGVQLGDHGVGSISLGAHRRELISRVRGILGECRVLGCELLEALIRRLELLGGRLQSLGELLFGRASERRARTSALRALGEFDGGVGMAGSAGERRNVESPFFEPMNRGSARGHRRSTGLVRERSGHRGRTMASVCAIGTRSASLASPHEWHPSSLLLAACRYSLRDISCFVLLSSCQVVPFRLSTEHSCRRRS